MAWATTFVERPFPDTVQDAPVIARGKIGMSYADWSLGQDGRKRLYTYYELLVDETFKGQLTDAHRVMIREMGGEKNGVGLQIPGAAKFERGEDVVLMLGSTNPDGSHDVRGLMMGKYVIEKDEEGKEYLAGAGVSMLTHPAIRGHEGSVQVNKEGQDDTAPVKKWTLEALRQLVREQARAEASKPENAGSSAVSPVSSSPPSASDADAPRNRDAAPRLQSSAGGGDAASTSVSPWIWGLGVAALLLLGVGVSFRRDKNKNKNKNKSNSKIKNKSKS